MSISRKVAIAVAVAFALVYTGNVVDMRPSNARRCGQLDTLIKFEQQNYLDMYRNTAVSDQELSETLRELQRLQREQLKKCQDFIGRK